MRFLWQVVHIATFLLNLTIAPVILRDLLQDFPALPSLQCVVSAMSLTWTPHYEDQLTPVTTQEALDEGASTSIQSKVRSIITPPENVTWSTAQLAPFVQRLAPGQPVEGRVF